MGLGIEPDHQRGVLEGCRRPPLPPRSRAEGEGKRVL